MCRVIEVNLHQMPICFKSVSDYRSVPDHQGVGLCRFYCTKHNLLTLYTQIIFIIT